MKQEEKNRWGDEAPEPIHFIFVFIAVAILVGLGWVTWFSFGWFH